MGIFVVWLPTVLISQSLSKDFPRDQMWKATLRGCPKFMQYILYGLFAYAFINFLLFSEHSGKHEPVSAATIRGFSGHWLIFYYAAFCILYSYAIVSSRDTQRRCVNGHVLLSSSKYCPECGAHVGDILESKS